MPLLDLLDDLTAATTAAVLALWARYEAGELDEAMFLTLAAAVLNAAGARATVMTDLAISADLRTQLRRPVRPAGLRPIAEQARLRQGIQSILADEQFTEPVEALTFITKSETVGSAQLAAGQAMKKHRVGWVRGLSGGACDLCASWADGKVRPPRITMIRHHGCRCLPRPVAQP